MNLLPTSDQAQIADSLRDFLAGQMPTSRFRPPARQVGNDDAAFWPRLGELGVFGVGVPEALGGIGLGAAEEMLLFREFGRFLVSPAVFATVLAAELAAALDRMDELGELLAGRVAVGLANPRGAVRFLGAGAGTICDGEFHLMDAEDTRWVLACTEHGTALFDRSRFGEVQTVPGTDHVVALRRGRLRGAAPLLRQEPADPKLYRKALLLTSAYAVGMAEAARDMAVEYAKVRQQFGKPIGSFQAVKHLCADMAIRAEAAHCQVAYAALVLAENKPGADFHLASAKLVATRAALENAAQNIQVHGAYGFTAEADAHLCVKRAHLVDQLAGDLRRQRERLIEMPFPDAA